MPATAEGGKSDKLGEIDQAEREEGRRIADTQKQAPNKVSACYLFVESADADGKGKRQRRGRAGRGRCR